MNIKKIMAVTTTTALVFGNTLSIFAADPQTGSITGTGADLGYLDTDVITCTVPTATLTNKFNFYADPNDLVKASGGKIATGSVTIDSVTANDDKVYFVNAGSEAVNASVTAFSIGGKTQADSEVTVTVPNNTEATSLTFNSSEKWVDGEGTEVTVTVDGATAVEGDTISISPYVAAGSAGYSSASDKVLFTGQNSIDVDLSAVVTITSSGTAAKDVLLVADETALAEATTPAMLLTAYVGDSSQAITGIGSDNKTTITETIAGKPDNFEVVVDANKYKYNVKDAATGWDTANIFFTGKMNDKKLEAEDGVGSSAPSISVAWSIAKHTGPIVSATGAGLVTVSGLTNDTVPQGVTLSAEGLETISIGDRPGTYTLTDKIAEDGTFLCQLGSQWLEYYAGKAVTVTVPLKDGTSVKTTVSFPEV